jgi:predicted anti-sigma-YlaC factor YlaD
MPDVALRRSEWTAGEAAHLADCEECRAEWQLVLAARGLDDHAPTISDPAAMATALRQRLMEDRAGRSRLRRAWSFAGAVAAAAGIVVAVLSGRGPGPAATPRTVAGAEALVPLPELEGLGTAQLDTLLQSIDRPFAGGSALDASTLGEHEDGELEQVFATWEG